MVGLKIKQCTVNVFITYIACSTPHIHMLVWAITEQVFYVWL